jgi:hypothetical protein
MLSHSLLNGYLCTFEYMPSVLTCWLLKCMKQYTLKHVNSTDSKKMRLYIYIYIYIWSKRTDLSVICLHIQNYSLYMKHLCRMFTLLIICLLVAFSYQNWYFMLCNMSLSMYLSRTGCVTAESLVSSLWMTGFSPRVVCVGCCGASDT